MDGWLAAAVSAALILGNAFFVAAEYALVGAKRTRLEALAKQKNQSAKLVLEALDNLHRYVAGIQIAITMFGIGIGAITEESLRSFILHTVGASIPVWLSITISFIIVTWITVFFGELVPKVFTIRASERVALVMIRPINFVMTVLSPLIWIVNAPISPFMTEETEGTISKDELLLLLRSGSTEGMLDKVHADMVSKALKLDDLDAEDIMIHRLDIQWIDIDTPNEEILQALGRIPHTRIPVCRGDIDDLVGIAYLHDVVKHWTKANFKLENILRPTIAVPENLSLDKIVATMRDSKTQILIVMDEYGGTSGLITLEDVVEEIFGELEDRLESERPPIETLPSGRISAKADIRFDELVGRLGLETHDDPSTDILAQIIVDSLGRVPKIGDQVETEVGMLRVENMARRRISRVSITLKPDVKRIDMDL